MIFQQRRLQREVSDLHFGVNVRQLALRQHVTDFGRQLHHELGTPGLLASGFGAGFLFDRMRPHWRGIYSAGGLGLTLFRFAPVAAELSQQFANMFRRSD